MTLEDHLAKIAKDNDLTTIAVGWMPVEDRIVWTASVHWSGFSVRGIPCESGTSEKSIAEAVKDALNKTYIDRNPHVTTVDALPSYEATAA